MLLVIIDIGIAVKKIVAIPQKYVLPESTWSFLPFSDVTARAAQSRAIVPARICIVNKICIILFPLSVRVVKNLVRTMVYKGHSVVCNYFVTLAYFSYFYNFSKPL